MERINAKTQIKRFMANQAANRLTSPSKSHSHSHASSNGKAVVNKIRQSVLNRKKKREVTDVSFEQTVKADFKELF